MTDVSLRRPGGIGLGPALHGPYDTAAAVGYASTTDRTERTRHSPSTQPSSRWMRRHRDGRRHSYVSTSLPMSGYHTSYAVAPRRSPAQQSAVESEPELSQRMRSRRRLQAEAPLVPRSASARRERTAAVNTGAEVTKMRKSDRGVVVRTIAGADWSCPLVARCRVLARERDLRRQASPSAGRSNVRQPRSCRRTAAVTSSNS